MLGVPNYLYIQFTRQHGNLQVGGGRDTVERGIASMMMSLLGKIQ